MNNTNRGLNRVFIFLSGVIILAVGGATIALGVFPDIRNGWKTTAPTIQENIAGWFDAAHIAGTTISSWAIVSVVVLALIIVGLLAFIFRQGHGHTTRFVEGNTTETGTTVILSKVAEQLLQDALSGRPELVSSHVSTYLVQQTPVLKVSATARRGVSPREVLATVETALKSLDAIVGQHVFASVQIGGGFRSRMTSNTRLD